MKVLMISTDRTLFGAGSSGGVVERHKKYANMAGSLDIIVFGKVADQRGLRAPLEHTRIHADNFHVYLTNSSKVSHFKAAYKLASKLLSENKYDLLVTQELAAPVGSRIKDKFNLHWIVSIHSMFFSSEWLKLNPVNWYMFYRIKRAIKKADAFRVTNKIIEEKLRTWGINKPILVQPTPVDIGKFKIADTHRSGAYGDTQIHPEEVPSALYGAGAEQDQRLSATPQSGNNPRGSALKILYVGRLAAEKNVQMLIRAFKKLTGNLELQIVGEGPEREKLEKLAFDPRQSAYGEADNPGASATIKFLGPKSHDELVDIYGAADIFVLPSNTESFGKVLIEAGAAGCALVATKTAGAKSIITNGRDGLLVDVNNEQQLYEALKSLIDGADLRKRLAEAAQVMAGKYDAEKATANLVNFWREIVKGIST